MDKNTLMKRTTYGKIKNKTQSRSRGKNRMRKTHRRKTHRRKPHRRKTQRRKTQRRKTQRRKTQRRNNKKSVRGKGINNKVPRVSSRLEGGNKSRNWGRLSRFFNRVASSSINRDPASASAPGPGVNNEGPSKLIEALEKISEGEGEGEGVNSDRLGDFSRPPATNPNIGREKHETLIKELMPHMNRTFKGKENDAAWEALGKVSSNLTVDDVYEDKNFFSKLKDEVASMTLKDKVASMPASKENTQERKDRYGEALERQKLAAPLSPKEPEPKPEDVDLIINLKQNLNDLEKRKKELEEERVKLDQVGEEVTNTLYSIVYEGLHAKGKIGQGRERQGGGLKVIQKKLFKNFKIWTKEKQKQEEKLLNLKRGDWYKRLIKYAEDGEKDMKLLNAKSRGDSNRIADEERPRGSLIFNTETAHEKSGKDRAAMIDYQATHDNPRPEFYNPILKKLIVYIRFPIKELLINAKDPWMWGGEWFYKLYPYLIPNNNDTIKGLDDTCKQSKLTLENMINTTILIDKYELKEYNESILYKDIYLLRIPKGADHVSPPSESDEKLLNCTLQAYRKFFTQKTEEILFQKAKSETVGDRALTGDGVVEKDYIGRWEELQKNYSDLLDFTKQEEEYGRWIKFLENIIQLCLVTLKFSRRMKMLRSDDGLQAVKDLLEMTGTPRPEGSLIPRNIQQIEDKLYKKVKRVAIEFKGIINKIEGKDREINAIDGEIGSKKYEIEQKYNEIHPGTGKGKGKGKKIYRECFDPQGIKGLCRNPHHGIHHKKCPTQAPSRAAPSRAAPSRAAPSRAASSWAASSRAVPVAWGDNTMKMDDILEEE